jgi:hypothetical protein
VHRCPPANAIGTKCKECGYGPITCATCKVQVGPCACGPEGKKPKRFRCTVTAAHVLCHVLSVCTIVALGVATAFESIDKGTCVDALANTVTQWQIAHAAHTDGDSGRPLHMDESTPFKEAIEGAKEIAARFVPQGVVDGAAKVAGGLLGWFNQHVFHRSANHDLQAIKSALRSCESEKGDRSEVRRLLVNMRASANSFGQALWQRIEEDKKDVIKTCYAACKLNCGSNCSPAERQMQVEIMKGAERNVKHLTELGPLRAHTSCIDVTCARNH